MSGITGATTKLPFRQALHTAAILHENRSLWLGHNAQESSRNAMPHHINRKPTSELTRIQSLSIVQSELAHRQ